MAFSSHYLNYSACCCNDFTYSNSSCISCDGSFDSADTSAITILEATKAGNSSYIPKMPPMGLISKFQMKTKLPPVSIPAIAPDLVTLFQKSEKRMIGPKVAPKPAHANDTTLNITLFSFNAIIIAIIDIITNVILDAYNTVLSEAFLLIIP